MTDMPKRIQLRRTKGWKKPENAVVVSRPSVWGNPFFIGAELNMKGDMFMIPVRDAATSLALYRSWIFTQDVLRVKAVEFLRGRDLCCWCPLEKPCHADILLEIANADLIPSLSAPNT